MDSFLPVRFAASIIFCASAELIAIGFSHITCLPASSASTVMKLCERFGVQTCTTSIVGSFRSSL